MSAIADTQILLYATLSQYNPLKDKVTGVYIDEAPEDATSGYVVTGETTMSDDGSKNRNGESFTCTIHAWEEKSSFQCKEILALVKRALEQTLTMNGYHLWLNNVEFMNVIQDPSGWKHGVLRVRLNIQE